MAADRKRNKLSGHLSMSIGSCFCCILCVYIYIYIFKFFECKFVYMLANLESNEINGFY